MARGWRRLSAADEDEIWELLRAGHAAKPTAGVGVVDLGGAGLPGAVWWDPACTQAPLAGPVEPGGAGGGLAGSGGRAVAAVDRGGSGACPIDDQP
jgi:hypothetical protein